jgi:hypothetical protein
VRILEVNDNILRFVAIEDECQIYVLVIQSTGEDLQEIALFWLGGPRKAKRCDICYGVALRAVFDFGRVSFIGAIRPHRPLNDDIYKTDTARSLPQLVTKRHPGTLFDLANPVAL